MGRHLQARERVQNTPDRGNEAGRESKSQEIKISWGWTLLRAVSGGTGKAGCGPLGLLPESRGGRTQTCILEASWCMSCKEASGTGRMGRGRLHICTHLHEVHGKGDEDREPMTHHMQYYFIILRSHRLSKLARVSQTLNLYLKKIKRTVWITR